MSATIRPWHYLAVLPLLFTLPRILRPKLARRLRTVPQTSERVLILGASSGIGRAIAHLYAARGARVCVVGRRKAKVDEVVEECVRCCREREGDSASEAGKVFGLAADFANVDDMVRVRAALEMGAYAPASNTSFH
jgi:NADPH:quinone reductase-like Zn-dependent oxidoreductase